MANLKNESYWHTVSLGKNPPEDLNVIVETPRGSRNKYEISKEFSGVVLDRVLHSSVVYPVDYGAIPRTLYDDGDPLDALVLVTQPTQPGIVLSARPIGLMKMVDQGELDNKILMVATKDPYYRDVKTYKDLPVHLMDEILNFFQTYKILENKKTEVTGWEGKEAAIKDIERSIRAYDEKFK